MRQAIDFIKDEIIEGKFRLGLKEYPLGVQPDGSVCFKKNKKDRVVWRGYILDKGYAVGIVKGAK